MQDKRVQVYDSMGGDGMMYLEALFRYVADRHKEEKQGLPLPDEDQWKLVKCTLDDDTPRQLNGTFSRVFELHFFVPSFLNLFLAMPFYQTLIAASSPAWLQTLLAWTSLSYLTRIM
jgi:hypothetical protein